MNRILQILPRVPPAICGIGDYAWLLARELHDRHDIHSSFLAAGTDARIPERELEFPIAKLHSLTAEALMHHLRQCTGQYDAIILHVSLYGYQKRAVPFWLGRVMTAISQMPGAPPVVNMFHELYTSASMKSSAFWLQPLQKMILRRLIRSADALRTNRESYATWIDQVSGRKTQTTTVMPVFSNFGELTAPPRLADRPTSMVLFASGIHGGPDVLQSHNIAISLCQTFHLETLHLIGGPTPASNLVGEVRLLHQKHLPSDQASALLSNCRMAYNAYHPEYLGKSTILATYAAHGLAVVTRGEQLNLPDGLQENREVLHHHSLKQGSLPAWDELQAIADRLHAWYMAHSLAKNALSYASDIKHMITKKQSWAV